jgi:hypothetical protein
MAETLPRLVVLLAAKGDENLELHHPHRRPREAGYRVLVVNPGRGPDDLPDFMRTKLPASAAARDDGAGGA